MFSWRKRVQEVEIGELYRRESNLGVGETAQVVSVWDDDVGIPHVRFHRRQGAMDKAKAAIDDRTLALSAFVQLYPQRAAI